MTRRIVRLECWRRLGLAPQPAGIYCPTIGLAAECDGTIALWGGTVVATSSELMRLQSRLEYCLDEPMPPEMLMNGRHFIVSATPTSSGRTKRWLILEDLDTGMITAWVYLMPEACWMVHRDSAWIVAHLHGEE